MIFLILFHLKKLKGGINNNFQTGVPVLLGDYFSLFVEFFFRGADC